MVVAGLERTRAIGVIKEAKNKFLTVVRDHPFQVLYPSRSTKANVQTNKTVEEVEIIKYTSRHLAEYLELEDKNTRSELAQEKISAHAPCPSSNDDH